MIGEPMTLEEYKRLASDVMMDTDGDCFAESGWGICFAFDIATALYVYELEICDSYEGDETRKALQTAEFHISPLFSVTKFLETDVNDEFGDDANAKMIYDELLLNYEASLCLESQYRHNKAKEYAKALVWFCEESDRLEEAKRQ